MKLRVDERNGLEQRAFLAVRSLLVNCRRRSNVWIHLYTMQARFALGRDL